MKWPLRWNPFSAGKTANTWYPSSPCTADAALEVLEQSNAAHIDMGQLEEMVKKSILISANFNNSTTQYEYTAFDVVITKDFVLNGSWKSGGWYIGVPAGGRIEVSAGMAKRLVDFFLKAKKLREKHKFASQLVQVDSTDVDTALESVQSTLKKDIGKLFTKR